MSCTSVNSLGRVKVIISVIVTVEARAIATIVPQYCRCSLGLGLELGLGSPLFRSTAGVARGSGARSA